MTLPRGIVDVERGIFDLASMDQNMAQKNESNRVPEITVRSLLKSSTVTIRDTYCQGSCRHKSTEECTATTQLVFPYRGVYVRHLGHDQAVAEANKCCFQCHEGYRISHRCGRRCQSNARNQ